MRLIDADLLKEVFEIDGYKSPYVARVIDSCPTIETEYEERLSTSEEKQNALEYLYRRLREAKISLGHAEKRKGISSTELDNIKKKIAALDWLIPLAIKEKECMDDE